MPIQRSLLVALVVLTWMATAAPARTETPPADRARVEAVLVNVTTLARPGQLGLATVWDGDKYVQCRPRPGQGLLCEAAGSLMQPSLAHVLTPERITRLAALGWNLDPSFGNYVRTFPPAATMGQVAEQLLQALSDGYDADLTALETRTDWVTDEPCPPRNGPTQNLAGEIDDAPAMAATAVHDCAYVPDTPALPASPLSAADLISLYGPRVTGEIMRLRLNADHQVFLILDTELGYIQCQPEASPAIYCEAQSADSWPALASLLTTDRVSRLHAAGYADPGRAPNYWRDYLLSQFDDAAIAREVLTVLHDVYGYTGSPQLHVDTETSQRDPTSASQ